MEADDKRLAAKKWRAKRLREIQQDPEDRAHGTTAGYTYGCRCERCLAAAKPYNRARYERRLAATTKEQRRAEWEQWAVDYGHGSFCPGCGKFTTRASGFCCKCDPAPKETRKERTARYLAELLADPLDPRHGTTTGYGYGCRCEPCATAAREQRKKRAAKRAEGKKGPHPWSRRLS